jgi:hypothetical protein
LLPIWQTSSERRALIVREWNTRSNRFRRTIPGDKIELRQSGLSG